MKTLSCGIIYLSAMLTGCGDSSHQADKFVGRWESHSFTIDIAQKDEGYRVEIDNRRGMLSGSYQGELAPIGLKIVLPLAGEQIIVISGDSEQLDFLGEQLEKQLR
ncbi:MAG: hypothetical protein ACI915_004857 [Gammaproteobacteria bacterium]|jgi:hypothetical protein